MPRPRRPDPPVRIHIALSQSLLARLELHLHDPIRGKPRYGDRSKLIESLLEEWLKIQDAELQAQENVNAGH